jgi:hypothetical protein
MRIKPSRYLYHPLISTHHSFTKEFKVAWGQRVSFVRSELRPLDSLTQGGSGSRFSLALPMTYGISQEHHRPRVLYSTPTES